MIAGPGQPVSTLRTFLKSGAAGGFALIAAAALAMIAANSPLSDLYFDTLETTVAGLDVLHWINDGLMALFFLLVGLEIKREMVGGQLDTWAERALPGLAALGGVVVPVLIYVAVNHGGGAAMRGWAVPAATDIAFALGILALLGSRVPVSLKLFLTTLAILDDLAAILIIAIFYTDQLALVPLAAAAGVTAALAALNRRKITNLWPYAILGGLLWFLVLKSGIHATVTGVVLAMTIPLRPHAGAPRGARTALRQLEKSLSPWVSYAIVPLFSFANAGVSFAGMTPAILIEPVTLGIAAGLFLGKPAGVVAATSIAIRLGLARLPAQATWRQFYGVALLCGIGFTMSLFIGLLAFHGPAFQNEVKIGVLTGSLLSGLCGWLVLRFGRATPPFPPPHRRQ